MDEPGSFEPSEEESLANTEAVNDTVANEQPNPASPWQYREADADTSQPVLSTLQPVVWTASEFVEHDKSSGWFISLAGMTLVVCTVIYLITREVFTTGAILLAAILFGVTASRKPSTLEYKITNKGVQIGARLYEYSRFKFFSVIQEGAFNSIQLMPLGRVAPAISLYYPPEQEDEIVNALANYLPHEQRNHDAVDRFMRRIRF